MSAEDEINRLDGRVTRLETSVFDRLNSIDSRLADLAVSLAKKHDCPEPGACIYLRQEINSIAARVNTHGLDIRALERWQWGMAGSLSIVAFVLTIFGPAIRAWLKLP